MVMQLAGISHRTPTSAEVARVALLEGWLTERRTGLDLARAYVHTKTASPASGSLEMHIPLVDEPDLVLVVDVDVSADTLSLHWAVETDGPDWPAWTAGEWSWSSWEPVLDAELRRRFRVTVSRLGSAKRVELEVAPGVWSVLQGGRLLGSREPRVFTISP